MEEWSSAWLSRAVESAGVKRASGFWLQHLYGKCHLADPGGGGAPKIKKKIMQFSGKKPLFWANFGLRALSGVKTLLDFSDEYKRYFATP